MSKSFKNIIAFVPSTSLNTIIHLLKETGVPGASIANVRGYGEYSNTFSHDPLVHNIRLDIIIEDDKVESVVELIMDHSGSRTGDGIVAVTSLDAVYRVRTRAHC